MKTLKDIDHWSQNHQSVWLDFIRIALGVFILIKGISFAADLESLNKIVQNSQIGFLALGLVHYVVFAHIVGGLLIALGLKTRIAVLFQLPVLLGAVVFINARTGFFSVNSELGVSLAILIMLVFYLIYGSGKFSIDRYMATHTFY